MKKTSTSLIAFSLLLVILLCSTDRSLKHSENDISIQGVPGRLIAKRYYSGFERAYDTYHAISAASNEKIYYALSSQAIDQGGQMYAYDPKTDHFRYIGDLTEACGEKGEKTISQGKSHVRFYERKDKLYFATHTGYYEMINGMERMPDHALDRYGLYTGGHFLSYDLVSGQFEDLAIASEGEGILTMDMDHERSKVYGITWPKGYFINYDLNTGKLTNLGQISANGEARIPGKDYRVLCRSMFTDPSNGAVYFSTSEGDIYSYTPGSSSVIKVERVNLRLDYFGKYDPSDPGSMVYNWRLICWCKPEGVAYGIHGNSCYLFRFDPRKPSIELVERITSEPSQKSGMFDQFGYGYLGFQFGPDGHTLYYLTGGPVYEEGKRLKGVDKVAMGAVRGLEDLHLVTYNIPDQRYTDHGAVFYEDGQRPTYVNSIVVGQDGSMYMLARFETKGKEIEDLIKIPNHFSTK